MITQLLPQNLKYLRSQLGFSLEELAEKVNIDPVDLYVYEKSGIEIASNTDWESLTNICHYFTVFLDDLLYTDLQNDVNFYPEIFSKLKLEIEVGVDYDRTNFTKALVDTEFNARETSDDETDENKKMILQDSLRIMHMIIRKNERYQHLRSRGLIKKNDFFEGK